MFQNVSDFEEFYKTPIGKNIKNILNAALINYSGNVQNQKIVSIGYTLPYMELWQGAEYNLACIPARWGCAVWPSINSNQTCLVEESELPLETNSVDKIFLIHALEYAELLPSNLQEIWRVLKGNGRLIVIAPNRLGFWSRAVWSPFGNGLPATFDQLRFHLRSQKFIIEQYKSLLYTPPIKATKIFENISPTFEKLGRIFCPALAGLYMIEASKQIYAGLEQGGGSKVTIRPRGLLKPVAVPSPRTCNLDEVESK